MFPEVIANLHALKALKAINIIYLQKPSPLLFLNDKTLHQLTTSLGFSSFLEIELLPADRSYNYRYPYLKISIEEPHIKSQFELIFQTGILRWEENAPNELNRIEKGTRIYFTDEDCNLLAMGYALKKFQDGEVEISFYNTRINQPIKCKSKTPLKIITDNSLLSYADELISVEKANLLTGILPNNIPTTQPTTSTISTQQLEEIWQKLKRKKQIILYGPPGTGKTYTAIQLAKYIISKYNLKKAITLASDEEIKQYMDIITFHPSYTYDDFIEGIKIDVRQDGQIRYDIKDGIFKVLCTKASNDPSN